MSSLVTQCEKVKVKQPFYCDNRGEAVKVEIMSDAALKLRYSKLTVRRTDVYGKIHFVIKHMASYKYPPNPHFCHGSGFTGIVTNIFDYVFNYFYKVLPGIQTQDLQTHSTWI